MAVLPALPSVPCLACPVLSFLFSCLPVFLSCLCRCGEGVVRLLGLWCPCGFCSAWVPLSPCNVPLSPTADRLKHCKVAWAASGNCPVCGRPDSAGHLLGYCQHPRVRRQVCKRHNRAVLIVHRAVVGGSLGASFAIMDAKPGVASQSVVGSKVPEWVAPVPAGSARRWRPDLLYIAPPVRRCSARDVRVLRALVDAIGSGSVPPPALLLRAKAAFSVHVVEVGFISESSNHWLARIRQKARQQDPLCSALRSAGWAHVCSHVVPVGSAATVFTQVGDALAALGVSSKSVLSTSRCLHSLAARSASSLVHTRSLLLAAKRGPAGPRHIDPG